MNLSFFSCKEFASLNWKRKEINSFFLTSWTHPIKLNLYFNKRNQLNNFKNSQNVYNSFISYNSLDKQTLLNYKKLYDSFLLNKQKYNIKLILSILKNSYEIRKRLLFINKTLNVYKNFSFKIQKTNKNLSETNFISNNDLKIIKKRYLRNFCLNKNNKNNPYDFKLLNNNKIQLKNIYITEQNKLILIYFLKNYLKKIIISLEKTYWIKYKFNIRWILHNKNLYYIKTKIINITNNNKILNYLDINNLIKNKKIFLFLGHILKLFSLLKSNDLTFDWFKNKNLYNKKNLSVSFYYLHLIYIKLLTLNLWKHLLSLRNFKIHKHYNIYILNEIIKPLLFQIYTRLDRLLLLSSLGHNNNNLISKKNINNLLYNKNIFQTSFWNKYIISFSQKSFIKTTFKVLNLKNNNILKQNLININKSGFIYIYFNLLLENLSLLKYISYYLNIRTLYSPFFLNLSKISSKDLYKQDNYLSSLLSSYYLKPLIFNNTNNTFSIYDKNNERNSFYISKIKDLSNPLLFYNLGIEGDINYKKKEKSKVLFNNKDFSFSPKNKISSQKNLPTIKMNIGPRILIKKTNNKLNIEWNVYSGLSRIDINRYENFYNKYSLIGSLSNKKKNKTNNNTKFNISSLFINNLEKKNTNLNSPLESALKVDIPLNIKSINLETNTYSKSLFSLLFSLKTNNILNKSLNILLSQYKEYKNNNELITINLLNKDILYNLVNYNSNYFYLLPTLKTNNLYHPLIKAFKLINLKKTTNKILLNQNNNIMNKVSINLPLLLQEPLNTNNILNKKNLIFFKNINKKKNNFKYLPLPKPPINDFNYQYLKQLLFKPTINPKKINNKTYYSKKINKIDINIKHYYSKTYDAYTLIENLSRFLIAFIKKNKGGKNKFQQLKNISYRALQAQIKNNYIGIGFKFSGRVYGAKKAMSFKMLFGSVPFNTLKANIDYCSLMQKTRNGTWGFQTWIHLKPKKSIKILPLKENTLLDLSKKKKSITQTNNLSFLTPFSIG